MKPFVGVCFLASTLLAQSARYTLEVEGKEETGEKPRLLCLGKTTLPERSRLDILLHYGEIVLGEELARTPVEVKEGLFSTGFSVVPGRNLPGTYFFQVQFNPHLQSDDVRKTIGAHRLRFYEGGAKLIVGTSEDLERERKDTVARLADEIGEMDRLRKELAEAYRESAVKPDLPRWTSRREAILHKAAEIQNRNYYARVPQYRLYRLVVVSDDGLETLCTLIVNLGEAYTRELEGAPDLEAGKAERIVALFDRTCHSLRVELGLLRPSCQELLERSESLRAPLGELRSVLKRPPMDPDQKAFALERLSSLSRGFKEQILALSEQIPENLKEPLATYGIAVQDLIRAVANTLKEGRDPILGIEERLGECERQLNHLQSRLKP